MVAYELSDLKFDLIDRVATFDTRMGAINDIKKKYFEDAITIPESGDDIIFSWMKRKNMDKFYMNHVSTKEASKIKQITMAVFHYSEVDQCLDVAFVTQNFVSRLVVPEIPELNDIVAVVYCIQYKDNKKKWIACHTEDTKFRHNDAIVKFVANRTTKF